MKDVLKKLWGWFGKKLIVVIVGLVLNSLKQMHPEWPLPDAGLVKDLVIAFLACHSATDIVAVLKTGGKELAKDVLAKLPAKP